MSTQPVINRFIAQVYPNALQHRFSREGVAICRAVLTALKTSDCQGANDAAKADPLVWGCWLRATGADQMEDM